MVYLFYQLVLRRITFYSWNRWYLITYSFLAFLIPFVNIYPVFERNNWSDSEVLSYIPSVGYQLPIAEQTPQQWTVEQWALLFFSIGAVVGLVRLGIRQVSFRRIRRKAKLILDDQVKIYQVDGEIIPFSYGNSIFINQHRHNQAELKEIIRHEFIHVKQRHTLDILWGEWLCILNWYNPFAWLIRHAIRQNLEFIADEQVLKNGIDRKEYQYLLLKVVGVAPFSIATSFNFKSLKKRIAMMNKIKTAKVHLLRFLFMLPLMAILLISFRNGVTADNSNSSDYPGISGIMNAVAEEQQFSGKAVDGLQTFSAVSFTAEKVLQRADTIPASPNSTEGRPDQINIRNNQARVVLRSGVVENYNLNDPRQRKVYISRYGELPTPASSVQRGRNQKNYQLSIADNEGEYLVVVKDRSGKLVRAMPLTEWEANEAANSARYGQLPPLPRADILSTPAPPADVNPEIVETPVEGYYYRHEVPGVVLEKKKSTRSSTGKKTIELRGTTTAINSDVLIVLDGVVQPLGTDLNQLVEPEAISSITVLKNKSAIDRYGKDGYNGVLEITTTKRKTKVSSKPALRTEVRKVVTNKIISEQLPRQAVRRYQLNGVEYRTTPRKNLIIGLKPATQVNLVQELPVSNGIRPGSPQQKGIRYVIEKRASAGNQIIIKPKSVGIQEMTKDKPVLPLEIAN